MFIALRKQPSCGTNISIHIMRCVALQGKLKYFFRNRVEMNFNLQWIHERQHQHTNETNAIILYIFCKSTAYTHPGLGVSQLS